MMEQLDHELREIREIKESVKRRLEESKTYTKEQMEKDIRKYGLDEKFGIYIEDNGRRPSAADSGYIIKEADGTFSVVITGERAIPISEKKVATINEAMAAMVFGLKKEMDKEEYYRNMSKTHR